jgi:peptidoglycan/xylan/chitin deacetylase (PgdA/CDA1 family)
MSRFHVILLGLGILWLFRLAAGPDRLPTWILAAASAAALAWMVAGVTWPGFNLFGRFLNRVPTRRRAVALTFDDGPHPDTTPALLDFLAKAGVRAAFFCVGRRVLEQPDLARRMIREGHLVANHSLAHHPATNLFSRARLRRDLAEAQAVLRDATGLTPTFFRPPMGLSNPRLFPVLKELGLTAVGWTARGLDRPGSRPETVAARLIRGVRPGAILLLHDGKLPPEAMKQTLRLLLDNLAARGYRIDPLDTLLPETLTDPSASA